MGQIIVIGGGEIKEKRNNTFSSTLLSHMLKNKHIEDLVVICPPPSNKKETETKMSQAFSKIVKTEPRYLFLNDNLQDLKKAFDFVEQSQMLYFAGGQQKKYMQSFTQDFIHLIHEYQQQKDVIIAGSSAGAMIFSENALMEGAGESSEFNDKISIGKGLNLLPSLIIDTHFIQRGRFARLSRAIKQHPSLLGLGLEENTAAIIEPDLKAKLYGKGTITVIDGSRTKTYKSSNSECITHLEVHLLTPGCTFDLNKCRLI